MLIPTWRRPAALRRCLAGLEAQQRPPDETIVVMRRGDASTEALLSADPPGPRTVRVVAVDAPGVVTALRAGLGAASGDVVAITDDDSVPRPDWLARIEWHFESDEGLGGVGGRDWVHEPGSVDAPERRTVGTVRWYGRVIGNHHLGAGGPRAVDVLKGVNMSYRRSALAPAYLDERLRGSGAQVHFELALGLALRSHGWKLLYDPQVAVDHYPAQRFDEDQRGGHSLPALRNAVHNETYALLRWLPGRRKLVALCYGVLMGTRAYPGLVLGLERLLRDPERSSVPGRWLTCLAGRIDGLQTFLQARS